MRGLAQQLLHTRPNADRVVRDQKEGRFMIPVRSISRRNIVRGILGQELQPLLQAPLIEQCGLGIEEVFDLLASGHWVYGHAASCTRTLSPCSFLLAPRSNVRNCRSSVGSGCSRSIPRDKLLLDSCPLFPNPETYWLSSESFA